MLVMVSACSNAQQASVNKNTEQKKSADKTRSAPTTAIDSLAFLEFLADMQQVDQEWVTAMDMVEAGSTEDPQEPEKKPVTQKKGDLKHD